VADGPVIHPSKVDLALPLGVIFSPSFTLTLQLLLDMTATGFPFLRLPTELRLQVYENLCSGPTMRLDGRLLRDVPTSYRPRRGHHTPFADYFLTSLNRVCRQIHDEAEEFFYGVARFEVVEEERDRDYGSRKAHFLKKNTVHSVEEMSRHPVFDKLRHLLLSLHDVADNRSDSMFGLQDRLYDLVSAISQKSRRLESFEVTLWFRSKACFTIFAKSPLQILDADWSLPHWKEYANTTAFLLEPFQFLRRLRSARLGCIGGSGRPEYPMEVMSDFSPTAGEFGAFHQHLRALMTSDTPTHGLHDMRRFYKTYSEHFLDSNAHYRFTGQLELMVTESRQILRRKRFGRGETALPVFEMDAEEFESLRQLALKCQVHCRRVHHDWPTSPLPH
jgi:hypothetical protein